MELAKYTSKLRLWLVAGATFLGWVLDLPSAGPAAAQMTDEQIEEIEFNRDYFKVAGEVEFDGQRIVYDETIEIRTKVGAVSNMGQSRGDIRTLMTRTWVARPVRGHGVLWMEVPDAAGLWTDLEGHVPQQRNWTPEYILSKERPPEEYLPEFYWVDDINEPTAIEAYVSESYYNQPTARDLSP